MISIQIKKLTKRFGPVVALQNLDLTINPGELFFLLGPSGCGKTTLLRCLAGFCVPDEGKIWFGEEEVTALAPHRRNAGMVFQSYALWPHLTVAENVAFGLEERQLPRDEIRRRTGQALEAVHMSAYLERKPNQLSGGQQQRVAIARALANQPALLLADEPTGNLDSRTSIEIMGVFQKLNDQGITIVMVTHELDVAQYTKRMIVMRDGKVVGDSPVTNRSNAEKELSRLQAEQKAVQLAN